MSFIVQLQNTQKLYQIKKKTRNIKQKRKKDDDDEGRDGSGCDRESSNL